MRDRKRERLSGFVKNLGRTARELIAEKLGHENKEHPEPAAVVAEKASDEFTSALPFADARCDALVIACLDRRFRAQTEEFLKDHLKLENPTIMALPGGSAPLVPLVGLTQKFLKGWLDFVVEAINVQRVICVAHNDCVTYQDLSDNRILNAFFQSAMGKSVKELQLDHLRRAKITFMTWFPGASVELYYADARPHEDGSKRVVFAKVD